MKQKLLTLMTLLVLCVTGAWADDPVTILDFSTGTPSDVFTISNNDGGTATNVTNVFMTSSEASTATGKTWTSPNDRKIQVTKILSNSAYYSILTTKSSYTDVKNVAIKLISTDKNSKYTVQISSKADFSSDVTTIQAETTLNSAGATSNNQWLNFSEALATPKSGYIRIKIQASSAGKFIGFTDFAITEAAPAGPTISSFSPATGSTVKSGTTVTIAGSTGSTVHYKWSATALTNDEVVSTGTAGVSGAATVTTTGITSSATTLYAVAVKDATTGTLATATYTIDDTAPTLSGSTPADDATGVAISGNIVLTFSENVTIADASKFSLSGGTLNTASATVSGATVTIPYSGLDMNTEYTLSTAAGAVQDAAGNTNVALSDITFTTLNDATPPTLSNSNPADGATGITSAVNVTLTFSENVVLSGDFTLTPSGATVGTPIVSDATITIPIKGMSYGTTYTLGLAKEDLEDEAGNALAADLSIGFTTMTTPATTKTWNFASDLTSTDDYTNFNVDTEKWTKEWTDNNKRFKNVGTLTSEVLMANGSPIIQTAGLLFTADGNDQIRVGSNSQLMIKNQSPLTIPNLKSGDEITIEFSSGNNSATRSFSTSNASLVYGTNSSPNYTHVTAVYKVTSDGYVTITPSDWMRFYSLKVATNSNNAVTVSSAAYATIVTTGNVDFSKTPGVTAYKATISGTSLVLSEVTAAPANTPLIIAADAAAYVLAITTDTPSAVEDNDLQAANTDITQADATDGKTIYVLNKVDDTVGFYKLSATGTLKAGKAYVELDSTTDASALNFFISDEHETDGVKAVNALEVMTKDGIYDMQGRKVIRPSKGLYIVNGKKVVIK